jgi:serine/threonine protein phosphatase 1
LQLSYIYALSDIHGKLDVLNRALQPVDLTDRNDQLIFVGDYIDRGENSLGVLERIYELTKKYPTQVIVLPGNHEQMFLDWIFSHAEKNMWRLVDPYLISLDSFLSEEDSQRIFLQDSEGRLMNEAREDITEEICEKIFCEHAELISWLENLPYVYETKNQIFIHAGVDERLGRKWRDGELHHFLWKKQADFGTFHKDIISGHIHTEKISEISGHFGAYYDGESHYYLDGNTPRSSELPILRYNKETGDYDEMNNGIVQKILTRNVE